MTPGETLRALQASGKLRSAWLPGMLAVVNAEGLRARIDEVPESRPGDLVVSVPNRGALWFGMQPLGTVVRVWQYVPAQSVGPGRWGLAGWRDWWPSEWEPVVDDPATVGCLLAQLREVAGRPKLYATPYLIGEGWGIAGGGPVELNEGAAETEGGSVIAALTAFAGGSS